MLHEIEQALSVAIPGGEHGEEIAMSDAEVSEVMESYPLLQQEIHACTSGNPTLRSALLVSLLVYAVWHSFISMLMM